MTKLITMLSLAATAGEDEIVAKVEAMKADHEKALESLGAVTKERDGLATELATAKSAKIDADVKAAVESFKITEAEAEDFKALAVKDPALFASMLSKREGKQPGGATIVVDKAKARTGAKSQAERQEEAIATYQKTHPEASFKDAMFACHDANPELFAAVEEE